MLLLECVGVEHLTAEGHLAFTCMDLLDYYLRDTWASCCHGLLKVRAFGITVCCCLNNANLAQLVNEVMHAACWQHKQVITSAQMWQKGNGSRYCIMSQPKVSYL